LAGVDLELGSTSLVTLELGYVLGPWWEWVCGTNEGTVDLWRWVDTAAAHQLAEGLTRRNHHASASHGWIMDGWSVPAAAMRRCCARARTMQDHDGAVRATAMCIRRDDTETGRAQHTTNGGHHTYIHVVVACCFTNIVT